MKQVEGNVSRETFLEQFPEHTTQYEGGFLLFAPKSPEWPEDDLMPVGAIFVDQPGPLVARWVYWFPWASKRNILESWIAFLRDVAVPFWIWAPRKTQDQRFFDHLCRYTVMRRVGTAHGMHKAGSAIYEAAK